MDAEPLPPTSPGTHRTRLVHLRSISDARGTLVVAEGEEALPFSPRRFFVVSGVPHGVTRGGHAQRTQHELLVAVVGRLHVTLDEGDGLHDVVLDRPDMGLYLPPMVWAAQHGHSPDAVLLVAASGTYDPADQVWDHAEFTQLVAERG